MIPLETIGVALIGYLLGSIPFGVLVSKRFGVDIYSVGSGNPGATNVLREIESRQDIRFSFLISQGLWATYWFMIPVFSIETDPVFGVMRFACRRSWAHLPLVYRFRAEGRGYGNGGLLGVCRNAFCWGYNLGHNFLFYALRSPGLIGFGLSLPICSWSLTGQAMRTNGMGASWSWLWS